MQQQSIQFHPRTALQAALQADKQVASKCAWSRLLFGNSGPVKIEESSPLGSEVSEALLIEAFVLCEAPGSSTPFLCRCVCA